MTYDPMGARFRAAGRLEPWQSSGKLFDFEAGFVKHIQRYLTERKLPADATDAKAWINKGFFNLERFELVQLQWSAYDDKRNKKSVDGVGDCDRSVGAESGGVVPDSRDPEITPQQQAANFKRLRQMIENKRIGG